MGGIMEIICKTCQSRFKISDERLPAGKSITIKCKKCNSKLEVHPHGPSEPHEHAAGQKDLAKKTGVISFDASEKPFDYLEEGVESALLCEHDLEVRQKIHAVLDDLDYHVVEAASARNALKYMRFHTYDLVVVNETFESEGCDTNHVLQYLSQLPIVIRREMFVILVSPSFRTMDNMIAFNKSVNLVVNTQDMNDMRKILKGSLSDHRSFYRVFKESLVNTGRV